jgi:hypothetical protein
MSREPHILRRLVERAQRSGVAVRGAFHPACGEFEQLPAAARAGTVVLLGFTGRVQWPAFADSAEANDGLRHPLDRWSRRVIGALALDFVAQDFYPSDTPVLPFQQFAMRCEPVHPSPIGLLIHPRWGLWHAYRGGLIFSERLLLPERESSPSPCQSCEAKPCLIGCPVGAFESGHYNLEACVRHVASEAGSNCRERGCRARRACPVGAQEAYAAQQMGFHMSAFLATFRPKNSP